ncbi:hypothetical protein A2U01_0086047, partial [Trifolium medium]|nr:hypothetical protein [Trifolium medium]
HNRNTGAVGGCEVEPDAAVDPVEVVEVMLLPVLPLNLSVLSERISVQEDLPD